MPKMKLLDLLVGILVSFHLLILSSISMHAQQVAKKYSGQGLKLEIAPLGLDQVSAFFIGRDFSPIHADFIAKTGCIFRSAIGNAGKNADDPKIKVQLGKWQVISNGKITGVKTRENWADIWAIKKIDETPKIAFHWSLFPTLQQYQPSDYNWGLISFALAPGATFDLKLHWTQNDVEQMHVLKNMECGK